jgi:hypothetical protein
MIATFASSPAARAEAAGQADSVVSSSSASSESGEVLLHRIDSFSIPFGYRDAPVLGGAAWWLWLGGKVPGLLITILAISLGAPFWFDVLQKFTNFRAAGQRPKSTETPAETGAAG